MTYYRGDTAIPGTSPDQQQVIEHLLLLAPRAAAYDGYRRLIYAELGAGPSYSDDAVMAAVQKVLTDNSGIAIPSGLFPAQRIGAVAAKANQLHSAKAGLSARTAVKA